MLLGVSRSPQQIQGGMRWTSNNPPARQFWQLIFTQQQNNCPSIRSFIDDGICTHPSTLMLRWLDQRQWSFLLYYIFITTQCLQQVRSDLSVLAPLSHFSLFLDLLNCMKGWTYLKDTQSWPNVDFNFKYRTNKTGWTKKGKKERKEEITALFSQPKQMWQEPNSARGPDAAAQKDFSCMWF